MNGAATVHDTGENVVTVHLTCISCGTVEEIHVFEERRLPREMYWECLDCQARQSRDGGWPEAPVHR